jgi:DNA modification methylase
MSAGRSIVGQGIFPSFLDSENSPLTSNHDHNKITPQDRGFHDWYRFVLSFPPHLVREYISRWGISDDQLVLDPFCGTGTTVVECKKMGVPSIGVEANPFAHFASMTKLNWQPKPVELLHNAEAIAITANAEANSSKKTGPLRALSETSEKLLISGSISPLPLHRLLILRDCIDRMGEGSPFIDHYRLALARIAVAPSSNLKFGPEVGVGAPKDDAPVVDAWLNAIREMAHDLQSFHNSPRPPASVLLGDARQIQTYIEPRSISAVFTSPPYPNEKDYSRTTRLEMTLLGFATAKPELQAIKRTLLRSNTRNVYKGDTDDQWVENNQAIQDLAIEIERRRIALNKTSGFEKLYAKVTKLYFGGMAKHLADLRPLLKPGAYLGYVVGDQASYLQVKIRTGELLAEIAMQLGYEVINLDLFRTRLATATREMLREEVLVLRWPLSEGNLA